MKKKIDQKELSDFEKLEISLRIIAVKRKYTKQVDNDARRKG